MIVHLVDGTYELFRYHFAPNNKDLVYGASRGVLGSVLQMLESGATHVGVATDHVIESFRNDLWPGYKTSAGMPPELVLPPLALLLGITQADTWGWGSVRNVGFVLGGLALLGAYVVAELRAREPLVEIFRQPGWQQRD